MKSKNLIRALSLLLLLVSFVPVNHAALAAAPLPPVDMFQLPWEQGLAWVALDGFDNGSRRSLGSPHNYLNGGAIDFAPHNNMIKGENTSNFWVTAAANGTIVEISKCHMKIAHANGWVSEYQHLANIQVKLGDVVAGNQKLAVIANASTQPVCPGSEPPDIPHLHFTLRPNMVGATFAGWEFLYSSFWNSTTFRKDGTTVGLFKPLLNVLSVSPTPTSTPVTETLVPTATPPVGTATSTPPAGPYVSTSVNTQNIQIGETALVTVSLNNVPPNEYTSAEFTCAYSVDLVETSNVVVASLFGTDAVTAMSNPQSGMFILAIAGSNGNTATTSGTVFTFDVKGLQIGQTPLECTARVSKGDNVLTPLPSVGTSLSVLGDLPTPTFTFTPTLTPGPDESPTPTITAFPTVPADWLTFNDVTYGFLFKYPPQGVIVAGGSDSYTRIDLPFVQGTNLVEKYLEMIVAENADPCQSPLATESILQTSQMMNINGIDFLKQTGGDAGAGNFYDWVAYSTLRDNTCVSLDFILHSLNPGNYATPPPVFDFAAESAVFDQIAATFEWLGLVPTATPTFTSTPGEPPTPTFTSTPFDAPTPTLSPTPLPSGMFDGQVIASKPVTVSVYDADNVQVVSITANTDGTFAITLDGGTYTVVATATGFLNAQGSFTLTSNLNSTLPTITLLAGDIDNNNVIDQFDALTIGMSYNATVPAEADLNNDGTINVLDLELLAKNYRQTGPLAW